MVKIKIQRGGGGMPKKQKGLHKSAAKEVSLRSPQLVFCAPKNGNCGSGQTAS